MGKVLSREICAGCPQPLCVLCDKSEATDVHRSYGPYKKLKGLSARGLGFKVAVDRVTGTPCYIEDGKDGPGYHVSVNKPKCVKRGDFPDTTVCVKCEHHQDDGRERHDTGSSNVCLAPEVEFASVPMHVRLTQLGWIRDGQAHYYGRDENGKGFLAVYRHPICRFVNTSGECPHYIKRG